jgi:hypothetical protein
LSGEGGAVYDVLVEAQAVADKFINYRGLAAAAPIRVV